MDAIEIGGFLSELRKQKGLKQKEVAEALQVSDKAVSRWETGRGIPDVDSLQRLSNFYEVSINEILAGRKIEMSELEDVADRNLKVAVKNQFRLKKKLAAAVCAVIILLILLVMSPMKVWTVSLVNGYCVSGNDGMEVLEEVFGIVDRLQEEGIDYTVSLETTHGQRFITVAIYFPGEKYYSLSNSLYGDGSLKQTLKYLDKQGDEEIDRIINVLREIGFLRDG